MSFYKYQSNKESQVDFSAVSSKVEKNRLTIQKSRDEKKAALEANYQELKTKIESESPLGGHAGANEAMAKFSEDAAKKALDMNRRMRNGDILPSDNTAYMSNLKGSTTQMFELGEAFNTNREELLARHQSGGVGSAEEMAYLEAAELFNGHGEPFVGDDGQVYLAARVPSKDGEGPGMLDTKNPVSLQQAKAMLTQRVDKFDLMGTSATRAQALNQPYTEAVKSGKIKTVNDARNNPAFAAALAAAVDADLGTPQALASILLDTNQTIGVLPVRYSIGEGSEDDEHKIHVITGKYNENTGQYEPELSDEQEALAKEIYMNTILGQIGRTETATAKTQQWELERYEGKKKYGNTVRMAGYLYNGDQNQINAAIDHFTGLDDKIKNIVRGTDGLVITYLDQKGTTVTSNIAMTNPDGTAKTQADFIRSVTELTGEGDLEDAIKRGNYNATTPTAHEVTGAGRTSNTPDKAYGELELDIAGQENLVSTSAAFDSVNLDGEVMRNNTEDRELITEGLTEVTNGILGNLTGSKSEGSVVGSFDDNSEVFTLFLPNAMTGPIFIPIEEGDAEIKTVMKNVTKSIYEAANGGRMISPEELSSQLGSFAESQSIYGSISGIEAAANVGSDTTTTATNTETSVTDLPDTGAY